VDVDRYCAIGEIAQKCQVPPKTVSDLLYRQIVPNSGSFPVIGGRRLIPVERVPEVVAAIQELLSRRKEVVPCPS
jgi:hypothetical protein